MQDRVPDQTIIVGRKLVCIGKMLTPELFFSGSFGDAGQELGVQKDAGSQLAAIGRINLVQAWRQQGMRWAPSCAGNASGGIVCEPVDVPFSR